MSETVPKKEGDDPADKAGDVGIDHMQVEVLAHESRGVNWVEFNGVDGWNVDHTGMLRITRRNLDVALYPQGAWMGMHAKYVLNDGSWFNAFEQGGAPEEVALGVEVTAIGGRTK